MAILKITQSKAHNNVEYDGTYKNGMKMVI